jgi:glutamate-1-semialdehyde 2,1-aminomutase
VTDFDSAITSNKEQYAKYFHSMLDSGVYLAPSQFEAMFLSAAHRDEDIELTIECNKKALRKIAEK